MHRVEYKQANQGMVSGSVICVMIRVKMQGDKAQKMNIKIFVHAS